jgi:MFS family permease
MTTWTRIFLLYGIGVLAAGQLGVVPPLVPALKGDLGMSLAVAGMSVSIVALIGAVFGLLAGGWCEKIGHVRALGLGMAIMAGAAALCAVSRGPDTLLAARGLAGAGYLLVVVAGPSLMATTSEPRHHPITLSLWSTFVPVGIAAAGIATASFVEGTSWRRIFAVDAALLAAALVAVAIVLPRTRATGLPPLRMSPESLRASLPLAVTFFCFALLFLALAGILPAYLVERRGLGASTAGRAVAIATAFGIAGSLAAGWMMRRGLAPGRLAALGLGASTVAAALAFSIAVEPALTIAGFAASFALGGLVAAAAFASVPLVAPDARAIGPINGLLAQAGSLGSLAGPPMLALWVEWAGWSTAPLPLLAVAALGAAAALAVPRA